MQTAPLFNRDYFDDHVSVLHTTALAMVSLYKNIRRTKI